MHRLILFTFASLLACLPVRAQWPPLRQILLDSAIGIGRYPIMHASDINARDLDGDNRADLIQSTHEPSEPFHIYWSSPSRAFGPQRTQVATPSWAWVSEQSRILYANLDGDPFPDIVVLDTWYTYNKLMLLNQGGRQVTFLDSVPYTHSSKGISFADLDGDGDDDLLDRTQTGLLLAYTNVGAAFAPQADTLLRSLGPSQSYAVKILDPTVGLEIFLPDSMQAYRRIAGCFVPAYRLPGPSSHTYGDIRWADIDSDGRLDLLVDDSATTLILYQNAQGRLGSFRSLPGHYAAYWATYSYTDIDGDGLTEALGIPSWASYPYSPTLCVFRIPPTGPIQILSNTGIPASVRPVALADVDADGKPDLVSYDEGAFIRRNLGGLRFAPPVTPLFTQDRVNDLLPARDAQGRDGLLANTRYAYYFLPRHASPGTGAYRIAWPYSTDQDSIFLDYKQQTQLFDARQTGRPDICTHTEGYMMSAAISPSQPLAIDTLATRFSLAATQQVVDIEGEGRPSLLFMRGGATQIYLRRNTGGSSLASSVQVPYTLPVIPGFAIPPGNYTYPQYSQSWAFDMDGDRKADLVLPMVNSLDSARYIFLKGLGDGSFLPGRPLNFTWAVNLYSIRWVDVNGDSLLDAEYFHGTSPIPVIDVQVRPGTFRTLPIEPVPGRHLGYLFSTADMNMDGLPDLAFYCYDAASNGIALYLGQPGGGVRSTPLVEVFPAQGAYAFFTPMALYDFDADGRLDIVGSIYSAVAWIPNPYVGQALLKGKVYLDRNADCQADTSEPGLTGWLVRALPTGQETITAADGTYYLMADTLAQILNITPGNSQASFTRSICGNGSVALQHMHAGSWAAYNFGAQVEPCFKVNLSATSLHAQRPCSLNPTTVRVSNDGISPVRDLDIHLSLPLGLRLESAGLPFTSPDSLHAVFHLDSLRPGQEQVITLSLRTRCDASLTGQMLCLNLQAFPSSDCINNPTRAGSDGSSLQVKAACQAGQPLFTVTNLGAAMADSTSYQLIAQDGSRAWGRLLLAAGDSLLLRPLALGLRGGLATHLLVRQRPGHADGAYAAASLADCSHPEGGIPAGLVGNLPSDEGSGQTTLCIPIRSSYDPNAKGVQPTGTPTALGNLVPPDARLRYTIRFENSGSDTAFRVAIRDSLSLALDEASVQVEAASHPFNLILTKASSADGAVLTFISKPGLALPYRAIDSIACQGFVTFSMRPKAALAERTRISNTADITFDFNPSMRTNAVTVTLSDSTFEASATVRPRSTATTLHLYPNPASQRLTLSWEDRAEVTSVTVLNAQGQTVLHQSAIRQLNVAMLPAGLYQVRVQTRNGRTLWASFCKE